MSVLVDQEEKYRLIEEAREGEEGLNFFVDLCKNFCQRKWDNKGRLIPVSQNWFSKKWRARDSIFIWNEAIFLKKWLKLLYRSRPKWVNYQDCCCREMNSRQVSLRNELCDHFATFRCYDFQSDSFSTSSLMRSMISVTHWLN